MVVVPANWIIAKQNVLCGASGHSQVYRHHIRCHFYIVIMNKHNKLNPHCEQPAADQEHLIHCMDS